VLLSAPQKGWSGSPGAGYVMLSERGRAAVTQRASTSFAMDLGKWLSIAEDYRDGKSPYHATMPTDTLTRNVALMRETRDRGLEALRAAQLDLGTRVRGLLAVHGLPSVAAAGFEAASVVVVHTTDPDLKTGARLKAAGLQVAAGVPLHCGERDDFSTFRIGLFGLDKLADVDGTVARLEAALTSIGASS
jgi:aspartate aminotransferase-like enzyme